MARLIGASYKSASVLRRLECKNAAGAKAKQPRSGFSIESLKGKSRVWHDLKGDVEVGKRQHGGRKVDVAKPRYTDMSKK